MSFYIQRDIKAVSTVNDFCKSPLYGLNGNPDALVEAARKCYVNYEAHLRDGGGLREDYAATDMARCSYIGLQSRKPVAKAVLYRGNQTALRILRL